jgi:D-alanine-D-alanine ligase-like ATP-grasp enzyme
VLFLKKRTEKLFHMASGASFNAETPMLPLMSKSFLLPFFKKEGLPFLVAPGQRTASVGRAPARQR